jgi:hypothetical protein
MTGPGLALIIIPVVTTACLVVWLTMVFSADGLPRQADGKLASTQASTRGKTAEPLPIAAATANRPIAAAASVTPPGQSRTAA